MVFFEEVVHAARAAVMSVRFPVGLGCQDEKKAAWRKTLVTVIVCGEGGGRGRGEWRERGLGAPLLLSRRAVC